MSVTIINFSDTNDQHLLVQGLPDGVMVSDGAALPNAIFIPDNAIRAVVRALQEYEDGHQQKLQSLWGV